MRMYQDFTPAMIEMHPEKVMNLLMLSKKHCTAQEKIFQINKSSGQSKSLGSNGMSSSGSLSNGPTPGGLKRPHLSMI